jgi:hypothetical protein
MCEYCNDKNHATERCGVRSLDFSRAIGFLVDFPDEVEANRAAGDARINLYANRTGVTIEQLLDAFRASFVEVE